MPFLQDCISVTSDPPYHWVMNEELVYEGSFMQADGFGQRFTIPKNYRTDFASTPRPLWGIFPPYGAYTLAAILHDWLLDERKEGRYHATSREIDGLFKKCLKEYDTGMIQANLMWTGVRWGAAKSKYRRELDWWRDAPKVFLVSTIVLLLLATVILGAHWLVEQALSLLS